MTPEIPVRFLARFTHGGREWVAKRYVNEVDTRYITRIKPVARPWPTLEEYRAARAHYDAMTHNMDSAH